MSLTVGFGFGTSWLQNLQEQNELLVVYHSGKFASHVVVQACPGFHVFLYNLGHTYLQTAIRTDQNL